MMERPALWLGCFRGGFLVTASKANLPSQIAASMSVLERRRCVHRVSHLTYADHVAWSVRLMPYFTATELDELVADITKLWPGYAPSYRIGTVVIGRPYWVDTIFGK